MINIFRIDWNLRLKQNKQGFLNVPRITEPLLACQGEQKYQKIQNEQNKKIKKNVRFNNSKENSNYSNIFFQKNLLHRKANISET